MFCCIYIVLTKNVFNLIAYYYNELICIRSYLHYKLFKSLSLNVYVFVKAMIKLYV